MRELLSATGFGVGGESLCAADKANSVKFISFINIPTAPANYIIISKSKQHTPKNYNFIYFLLFISYNSL